MKIIDTDHGIFTFYCIFDWLVICVSIFFGQCCHVQYVHPDYIKMSSLFCQHCDISLITF